MSDRLSSSIPIRRKFLGKRWEEFRQVLDEEDEETEEQNGETYFSFIDLAA